MQKKEGGRKKDVKENPQKKKISQTNAAGIVPQFFFPSSLTSAFVFHCSCSNRSSKTFLLFPVDFCSRETNAGSSNNCGHLYLFSLLFLVMTGFAHPKKTADTFSFYCSERAHALKQTKIRKQLPKKKKNIHYSLRAYPIAVLQ